MVGNAEGLEARAIFIDSFTCLGTCSGCAALHGMPMVLAPLNVPQTSMLEE